MKPLGANTPLKILKIFFLQFGYYSIEWEEGQNKFEKELGGNLFYRYLAFVTDFEAGEQKKIVIDIPFVFYNEGIIVTIY